MFFLPFAAPSRLSNLGSFSPNSSPVGFAISVRSLGNDVIARAGPERALHTNHKEGDGCFLLPGRVIDDVFFARKGGVGWVGGGVLGFSAVGTATIAVFQVWPRRGHGGVLRLGDQQGALGTS